MVQHAVGWWLAELAGLMPKAVRRAAAANRNDEIVLRFGLGEATLTTAGRKGEAPAIIPIGSGNEASTLWVRQRFLGSAARIILSDDVLFRSTIELPANAEANMVQILGHQLERLVPLEPSSLGFVWSIAERLTARNRLSIAVTIVRKATLEAATSCARQLGLSPSVILISHGGGQVIPVWRNVTVAGTTRQRQLRRCLEAATIAICLAAYMVHITRLNNRLAILRGELGPAQAQLRVVHHLSQQLANTRSTLAAIEARLAAPTPLAVLDELTRRLPADAYLSEFAFKPEEIEVIGNAAHATALLEQLTQSVLFDDPQFAAPITAAADGKGEHFELNMKLRTQKP